MGYKDPKNVRSIQTQTRITPAQKKKLERLARRNRMTPSTFLQMLLEKAQ